MTTDLVKIDEVSPAAISNPSIFFEISDSVSDQLASLEREKKDRRAEIREDFGNRVREATDGLEGDTLQRVAAFLYFKLLGIPVSWLDEAFGFDTRSAAYEWPIVVGKPCPGCGDRQMARSRAEVDRIEKWSPWHHGICPKCWPRCCYCDQAIAHQNANAQWYVDIVRDGSQVWHAECGERQQHEAHARPKEEYAKYLESDHWRSVRQWALERANRRCQVCNTDKEPLHVHHRTYERVGGELPEDLIVLCAPCHSTFHENGRLA